MLVALGVLAVTALLLAAVWVAVQGGTSLTQHDLNGKRAYGAATAGINAYLYQLNQNPNYWETCSNDSATSVALPGATGKESYSYAVIPANGYTTCTSDPIASLIDTGSGTLRVEFTGYAGNPSVKRVVVASFRVRSPFDFLWYTVYEALDSSISGYSTCGQFYRTGSRPSGCNIYWANSDVVNGPMYTEDQYLISASAAPTFGRGASDSIESAAPGSTSGSICGGNSCGSANILGTPVPDAGVISPPSDNSFLSTDAASYGRTYTGTTTIVLSGGSATVTNCPTSSCSTTTLNPTPPVIYVANGSGCSVTSYSPFGPVPAYSSSGCAGDVYVSGNYTSSVTIGAANNIIINGNLTTTTNGSGTPTGSATLGLVANQFVRVMHGVSGRSSNALGGCGSATNVASQTLSNLTIDGAILAISHGFIVDNFDCGATLGTLSIHGALAQYFRGTVGTLTSAGVASTGYVKNYVYDDRLKYLLPPYLFDISNGGWEVARETLCTPSGSNPSTAC